VTPERVLELLERVAAGEASPRDALDRLSWLPVESVQDGNAPDAFARLDHHREMRLGFPEVVFCPGKSSAQVVEICQRLVHQAGRFLATRADEDTRHALQHAFPRAQINETGRTVLLQSGEPEGSDGRGTVLIATAGTADLPVAEEAAVTASALGNPVDRLYDVGVAGLHRLLESSASLQNAAVLIVVAGMDGALPSVVGGLLAAPVIAVPTSTGYGASFSGLSALLAMLNSCASGVTVVNIDNGFGAACAATRINRLLAVRNPRSAG
jgi:NCAIR mutase (PurE)-related protein